MWLLSCDGPLWSGQSRWLRPGSTHLFGRTSGRSKDGAQVQYIDHKSVSRQHLFVNVSTVTPADSGHLHIRTEISLTDNSKAGTLINGEKLSKSTKKLDGKEYTIKLGSYESVFKLVWRPVVFCCTNLEGKSKAKAEALSRLRDQMDGADFKLAQDYVTNVTTHLAARKRNTPTGLQALVQGNWMVTYDYFDALARAIKRDELDENGDPKPCRLELEFEGAWPSERKYLVPAGAEPVPRDPEYLVPRPERADVFSNYTIIFLSQGQFENLLPVITGGGGKALVWPVEIEQSKVADLVDYVKSVAGKKGGDAYRLSQHKGKGGIVVVQLSDTSEWAGDFIHDTSLALGQRTIAQNEFLDAILTVDASGLRTELQDSDSVDPEGSHAQPSPPTNIHKANTPTVTAPEPSSAVEQKMSQQNVDQDSIDQSGPSIGRKRTRRIIAQPKFQGFDDFDPSQFAKPKSVSPEPSYNQRDPSQGQKMEVDSPMRVDRTEEGARNERKRPAPAEPTPAEDYDDMLEGQAAMKRRKLEKETKEGKSGAVKASNLSPERPASPKRKPKKVKEVDIRAEVRARREHEEEERRKDEEALQSLHNIDLSELKNLAIVEEMDVPMREPTGRGAAGANGQSDRWDPAWNGRKNFKKFRPQGQRRDGPRLQRVIVRLEEVPRKGNGIGDEYWLQPAQASHSQSSRGANSNHNSNHTAEKSSRAQSQSQSQSVRRQAEASARVPTPRVPDSINIDDDEDDEESSTRFSRRRMPPPSRSKPSTQVENFEEDIDDDEAFLNEGPSPLATAPSQAFASAPSTQTLKSSTQSKTGGKRPAAALGSGGGLALPPSKKARQTKVSASLGSLGGEMEDEDDDDGLKFRRRKRKG